MPQHDYVIDNQASASARADLNSLFQAIVSQNSGATAPATTYANMFWYETDTNILWKRNEANSAWISLGTVDETNSKFEPNQTFATQAEAQAGTNNTKATTPLRVAQAIAVLAPESPTPLSQRFKLAAIPSSTTYTVAAGKQACIIAVGGGGSGAQYSLSSVNDDRTCFGGNGGSAVRAIIKPSTSLTLTITIGAGGVSTGVSAGGVGTNGVAGSATTVTGTGVSISAAGGAGGTYHTAGTATGPTNGSSSGGDVFLSGSSSANTTDGLRFTSGTTPFGGGSQSITNTSVSGNMWYDIDRVGLVASGFTYISRASVSADRFADYPSQMLYARQMLITPFQGLTKSTEFVGDMPFDGMETPGAGIYVSDGNATGGTGGRGCGGGGALKGGGSSVTARGGTGGAGYVIILEEL